MHCIFVEKLNVFKMPLKFILITFSKTLSDIGFYSIVIINLFAETCLQ